MKVVWFVTKENSRLTIRSTAGKRYPREKYKNMSQREIEDLVIRLNGKDPAEVRAKQSVDFKHAFISPALMDDYFIFLKSQIPKEKEAITLLNYLKNYALNFFIVSLGLPNPTDWHRKQHVWALYLQNRDEGLKPEFRFFGTRLMSSKVIRYTVAELNRFMAYLHNQRPEEVIPLKFSPMSRAMYKTQDEMRKMKGLARQSLYIKPADWKTIEKALPRYPHLKSPVLLAYYYGSRRDETLGLQPDDVKRGHLSIERQVGDQILKDKEARRVPHWFTDPKTARALIEQLPSIHPDTVSTLFSQMVSDLGLPGYVFKDLRRTFATNAVKRKIDPEDLRLAMGHASIETTYSYYVADSRELADEIYSPDDAA